MYWIRYEFRDNEHLTVWSGLWMCTCLEEVGAFYGMVARHGGWCRCDINNEDK